MPDMNDAIPDNEKRDLILRMLASASFAGTTSLSALLRFLWTNRTKSVVAKDVNLVKENGTWDDSYVRERIHALQERIAEYFAQSPNEKIQCVLPKANKARGYQLQFLKTDGILACRSFWAAHVGSEREIDVVLEPMLFYWDDDDGIMMRFMNANIEGTDRESALAVLKKHHEQHHKESLIPGHIYIEVGSVLAAEAIRDFLRVEGKHTHVVVNKQTQREWQQGSPILIGNERTSAPVKRILRSVPEGSLAYRLDEHRYAGIALEKPTPEEIEALEKIGVRPDADGNFWTPLTKGTFGIVRRIPNPFGGDGVMTLISADGTLTTRQIAAALVDEVQLRPIFAKLGWRFDKPLPATFEILFFVRLWPGGFDDRASEVKFICGRPQPSVKRPARKQDSSRHQGPSVRA